jgi:hypothetical protein
MENGRARLGEGRSSDSGEELFRRFRAIASENCRSCGGCDGQMLSVFGARVKYLDTLGNRRQVRKGHQLTEDAEIGPPIQTTKAISASNRSCVSSVVE